MGESTPAVKNGKLVASKVIDKVKSKIEKGSLTKVDAIVVHQTVPAAPLPLSAATIRALTAPIF